MALLPPALLPLHIAHPSRPRNFLLQLAAYEAQFCTAPTLTKSVAKPAQVRDGMPRAVALSPTLRCAGHPFSLRR